MVSRRNRTIRVLVFNCTSGRSGATFLASMLARASAQLEGGTPSSLFDHVVFCTNITYADGNSKAGIFSSFHFLFNLFSCIITDLTTLAIAPDDLAALTTQQELAKAWSSLVPTFPDSAIHVLPSIQHAVDVVRGLRLDDGGPLVHVLVAGSLHLVGGVIEVAGLSDVAFNLG
jgi:folylpolyglutamate synthase